MSYQVIYLVQSIGSSLFTQNLTLSFLNPDVENMCKSLIWWVSMGGFSMVVEVAIIILLQMFLEEKLEIAQRELSALGVLSDMTDQEKEENHRQILRSCIVNMKSDLHMLFDGHRGLKGILHVPKEHYLDDQVNNACLLAIYSFNNFCLEDNQRRCVNYGNCNDKSVLGINLVLGQQVLACITSTINT